MIGQLSPNSVRVELANGNRMLAGISSEIKMKLTRLLPGQGVQVEFSAYDLSKGRIIDVLEKK